MKIKFFTLLAAFAFALGAAAGDTITVNYVKYALGGDTAVVSGLADGFDDYMNSDDNENRNWLEIPYYVEDANGKQYTVTTIGPNGIGSSDLTKVNTSIIDLCLSPKIKYIKEYGLANLTAMTSLYVCGDEEGYGDYDDTVPQIEYIGDNAFFISAEAVLEEFPDSFPKVTYIGENAFRGQSAIAVFSFPALTHIGESAFNSCGFKTFTMSDNVTYLGAHAFRANAKLQKVTFSQNLTYLPSNLFDGCSALTTIALPNALKTIPRETFTGCSALTTVYPAGGTPTEGTFIFPESLDSIGLQAFYKCTGCKALVFNDALRHIGYQAFGNCTKLVSVEISAGLTNLDMDGAAFEGSALEAYLVDEGNTAYSSHEWSSSTNTFGVLYNKDQTTLIAYPPAASNTYTILPTTRTISRSAFAGNKNITSVSVGDAPLDTIGYGAFNKCYNLASFEFTSSLRYIGSNAFSLCYALKSVDLPEGITTVVQDCFAYCTSLTSLTLPKTLTILGARAFQGCSALPSVELPSGLSIIGNQAFQYCSKLDTIEIPSGVNEIGIGAFQYCSGTSGVRMYIPAVLEPNSFDYSSYTLYVPAGMKETFEKTIGLDASGAENTYHYPTFKAIIEDASETAATENYADSVKLYASYFENYDGGYFTLSKESAQNDSAYCFINNEKTSAGETYVKVLAPGLLWLYNRYTQNCSKEDFEYFKRVLADSLIQPETGYYRLGHVANEGYYLSQSKATGDSIVLSNDVNDLGTIVYFEQLEPGSYAIAVQGQYLQKNTNVANQLIKRNDSVKQAIDLSLENLYTPGQIRLQTITDGTANENGYLYMFSAKSVAKNNAATTNPERSAWTVSDAETVEVALNKAGDAYYATICTPFPFNVDGADALIVSGKGEGCVHCNNIGNYVPAGAPVVLKGSAATKCTLTIDPDEVGSENVADGNMLYGGYKPRSGATESIYVLATLDSGTTIGFYRLSETGTLLANRAYLLASDIVDANARGLVIVFDGENNATTGVSQVTGHGSQVTNIFDLQGRKQAKLQKGVNIVNGQKIIR